jgi:hypothetical protein
MLALIIPTFTKHLKHARLKDHTYQFPNGQKTPPQKHYATSVQTELKQIRRHSTDYTSIKLGHCCKQIQDTAIFLFSCENDFTVGLL